MKSQAEGHVSDEKTDGVVLAPTRELPRPVPRLPAGWERVAEAGVGVFAWVRHGGRPIFVEVFGGVFRVIDSNRDLTALPVLLQEVGVDFALDLARLLRWAK